MRNRTISVVQSYCRLAVFLVPGDAAYINGESIRIDGGASRSL
ncbi:hypothetical protein [Streptomyces sp. ISL-100]|nr:hypothetical protein [Streptomyces sp. ISL-100]